MVSTFLTAAMAATLAQSPAPQATRPTPAPAPAVTAVAPQVDNPWVHLIPNLGRDLQAFVAPETAGLLIGGGVAATNEQAMAREYALSVPFDDLPQMLERLLGAWLVHRNSADESFFEFCRRHEIDDLRALGHRAPIRAVAA